MSRPTRALRIVATSEDAKPEARIGDIVRTGGNLYPHYELIAISSGRAWIRDVRYGDDHVVPIDRLHPVA